MTAEILKINNYLIKFTKNEGFLTNQEKEKLFSVSILSKHKFYLNLFFMFSPLFPEIKKEELEQLTLCGYLYFRGLLEYDHLIDDKKISKSEKQTHSKYGMYFLEEAIKGLLDLFPHGNPFWENFHALRRQYNTGLIIEIQTKDQSIDYNFDVYKRIAKNKSCISLASINALCNLSNNFMYKKALERSLIDLHIGFQIFDDIDDFRSDLQNNQKTYPIFCVKKFLNDNNIFYNQMDFVKLYKYFFISGIAIKNIKIARTKFQQSLRAVEHLNIKTYKSVIKQYLDDTKKRYGKFSKF